MANNLVITFSLEPPAKNHAKVLLEIHSLGQWKEMQEKVYVVHTNLGATDAAKQIRQWLNEGDRLFVIHATHIAGYHWGEDVENYLARLWI